MNITLTPELENLVREEISSGSFESPHEVLREGLLLLKELKLSRQERIENLRREVQKGIDQIREGKSRSYDSADEMMEEIISEARAEFEAKNRMANKFELAELARADLKVIWTYFAEFNQNSADKFMRNLAKKFQLLADNPKLGRVQDDLLLNLRSFPYKNHTILYFPTENGVEIYRVLHGARNIEDLFETYFEGLKP